MADISVKVLSIPNGNRREVFERQCGFDFDFFDAILPGDRALEFDAPRAEILYGRKVREVEQACASSHRKLIDSLSSSEDEWLIVLEDDAIVEPEFYELVLGLPCEELVEPTVLILGHCKTVKKNLWWQRLKQPEGERTIFCGLDFSRKYFINFFGTVGYAINKSAADLISSMPPNFWIADDWERYENIGIAILHACRPIVWENRTYDSGTGGPNQTLHRLFSKDFVRELLTMIRARLRQKPVFRRRNIS